MNGESGDLMAEEEVIGIRRGICLHLYKFDSISPACLLDVRANFVK